MSFSAVVNVTTTSVIVSGSILGRNLALITWEGNRYECGTVRNKRTESLLEGVEAMTLSCTAKHWMMVVSNIQFQVAWDMLCRTFDLS